MRTHLLFTFSLALLFSGCENETRQPPAPTPETSEYEQIPLIRTLNEKIKATPGDATLYYQRSNAYLQLGNFQLATADITQAVRLDSMQAKYHSLLAGIYFEREEFTRAILVLEKAVQLVPNDVPLKTQLARYYLYTGEHPKSIALLDKALQQNVFNAEAYFLKGMIFKEIGDTAKSISNFQTAVEQNPKYYEAYMQLGLLFSRKKDRLALDYYSNALKTDSTSKEARYGIAMYYQEIKEYEKALEIYHGFVLEFPQDKDGHYNTGYVYFQMDSFDKAERSFERAINVAPAYDNAYYMRGLCAEAKRDLETAKYFYRQTLNLNSNHALAQAGLKRVSNL